MSLKCFQGWSRRQRSLFSGVFSMNMLHQYQISAYLQVHADPNALLCGLSPSCLEKLTPQAPKWHHSSCMGRFRKITHRRGVVAATLQASKAKDTWRLQQHQNEKKVPSKVFLTMDSPCLWLYGVWSKHQAVRNGSHPLKWNHEIILHAADLQAAGCRGLLPEEWVSLDWSSNG